MPATATLDVPALAGSETQTRWAARVRAEKLAQVLRSIDQQESLARADGLGAQDIAQAVERARAIVQGVLSRRTHAGWWIDQRAYGALRTFELD